MIKLSEDKQRLLDKVVKYIEDSGYDIEDVIKEYLTLFSQNGFLEEGKPNCEVKRTKLPRKLKKKHKKERVYDFDIIRHNVPVKKVEFDLKLNML